MAELFERPLSLALLTADGFCIGVLGAVRDVRMGAADVDGVKSGVRAASNESADGVDVMRLFLDGVVSGTLSAKDGGSVYSVTVEREEGTFGFFADLILPVVCGRTGLCSGTWPFSDCSITLTLVAGEPVAASSAGRLRRPGVHFTLKPLMILFQGDCADGPAGALSGAVRMVVLGCGARGVCRGISSAGEATTATAEVGEVAVTSMSSVRSAAGEDGMIATAVVVVVPRSSAKLV